MMQSTEFGLSSCENHFVTWMSPGCPASLQKLFASAGVTIRSTFGVSEWNPRRKCVKILEDQILLVLTWHQSLNGQYPRSWVEGSLSWSSQLWTSKVLNSNRSVSRFNQPVGRCHQKKHGKITRRHVWSYPLGMIFTTYIFIVRLGMVYGMNGLPHEYTWIISNRTTNHVLIIDHLLLSDILVLGYVDMAVSQNVLPPPEKKVSILNSSNCGWFGVPPFP